MPPARLASSSAASTPLRILAPRSAAGPDNAVDMPSTISGGPSAAADELPTERSANSPQVRLKSLVMHAPVIQLARVGGARDATRGMARHPKSDSVASIFVALIW